MGIRIVGLFPVVKSRSRRPGPGGLFKATVVALVPAIMVALLQAVAIPPTASATGRGSDSAAVPAASGRNAVQQAAMQEAKKTGKPVPIGSMTTADSTTVANPDGTFTSATTPEPTRMKDAKGVWHDLDPTLIRRSDGTFTTTATEGSLVLSGGGSVNPLVTLADAAGHSFGLTVGAALPAPRLSGAAATYANVYPGVDIVVTAEKTGGFREVVAVHDAAAAADAAHLRFGTVLSHAALRADSSGNLSVVDPATGKVVLSAPPAALWDSATTGTAAQDTPEAGNGHGSGEVASSTADGPGRAAHTARLPITVGTGSLSLDNDASALLGKDVQYPVYFDPTWVLPSPSGGEQAYDEVQSGCPSYENFDQSALWPGVGQEDIFNPCEGVYRAFYTVDSSVVNSGDTIVNATLKLTQMYSALKSCKQGTEQIYAYWTAPISSSTSWNNMPATDPRGNPITSAPSPSVGNSGGTMCPGQTLALDMDFTGAVKQLAAINAPSLTFALTGNETAGSESMQRFAANPSLVITYDIIPNTPTAAQLSTSPAPHTAYNATEGCVEGTAGYVNKSSLNGTDAAILSATLTSNMSIAQLYGAFEFYDHTTNTNTTMNSSGYVASGGTVSVESPPLADGHTYTWQVNTEDQYFGSGTSPYCTFTADLTPPKNPAVASTDYPASGSGSTSTRHQGQAGTFNLASTDPVPAGGTASGLAGFYYSLDTPIPATGGTFTSASSASLTPTTWGIHTLYVQAVDNADNVSAQTQYSFYVPWDHVTTVVPGDLNGDGVPDFVTSTTSGSLVEYPGDADTAIAPVTISAPTDSPDGTSWANYSLTHRGSFSNQGVDDMWAFNTQTKQLYLYKNLNHLFENPANVTVISKKEVATDAWNTSPTTPDNSGTACATTVTGSCAGYDNTDWSTVTQILAVGDFYAGTPTASFDPDKTPGLLTVEGGALWYYQGQTTNFYLGTAVQLGTSGWDGMTLLGPGTVGGAPVLWARDKSSGKIYSYPITYDSKGYPVNLGTPTTNPTVLNLGSNITLDSTRYPGVVSPGDLHRTGNPDLVAVTANGEIVDFPGTAPASASPATATFGEPTSLGDPSTSSSTPSVSFASDFTFYPSGSVWTTKKNTLTFDNGTLTVSDTATGTVLSSFGPGAAYPNAVLTLQSDGNLVIYTDYQNTNTPVWALNKTGDSYDLTTSFAAGDLLTLTAGGNLDLTANGGGPLIWGTGTIRNQNAGSGFCLDADTNTMGKDGTVVQLWGCNATAEQNWTIALNGSSGYQIQNSLAGATYCLDADTNTMGANGTKVQLWSCNASTEQQWPTATGSSGATQIVKNGNTKAAGYCLDADTGTTGKNGTIIQLYTCNSVLDENWLF